MQHELTRAQKILMDRYWNKAQDEEDRMILLSVSMGANSFGFEDKIMAYLDTHPDATLKELDKYAEQFFPELVIEDD